MKKHLKTTQNFTIEKKPTYFYIKKQELGTFTDFAQVVGKSKIDGNIAAPIFGVYLVTVATFALIVF